MIPRQAHDGGAGVRRAARSTVGTLFEGQVRLHPERVLCPAGEAHRLVTSGGAASWEDLALYLVGRFCGAAEAVRIAKLFLLGDRSAGQ